MMWYLFEKPVRLVLACASLFFAFFVVCYALLLPYIHQSQKTVNNIDKTHGIHAPLDQNNLGGLKPAFDALKTDHD